MGRRKKYPRLPNGFGSIRYLGTGRRNPYAVHPPATLDESTGDISPKPALCYVKDYMTGFLVLTAYHAGTYKPGYELTIQRDITDKTVDAVSSQLLADYRKIIGADTTRPTFAEVYEQFYAYKFPEGHTFSQSTVNAIRAGYRNCSQLHDKDFYALKYKDLQRVVDECPLKHASLEHIINLMHQMYEYALMNDLCERNYSQGLKINKADDDEKGIPFTPKEIMAIYAARSNEVAEMLWIMCLSGFRIEEYRKIQVNTSEWYFHGGNKSRAGKTRIVPIHSAIREMVAARIQRYGKLLPETSSAFRADMDEFLPTIGIREHHTPHDCRHTFSYLCEKYEVAENDRKRMLGHQFKDVTNRVYGHRDLEDLRKQIEKIRACDFYVTNN